MGHHVLSSPLYLSGTHTHTHMYIKEIAEKKGTDLVGLQQACSI